MSLPTAEQFAEFAGNELELFARGQPRTGWQTWGNQANQ